MIHYYLTYNKIGQKTGISKIGINAHIKAKIVALIVLCLFFFFFLFIFKFLY